MKMIRYFNQSAGVLLLAMGLALFLSNWASRELAAPLDPVLQVSLRALHWVVGAALVGAAVLCLFGERLSLQATLVLWLAADFWVYVIGLRWSGAQHVHVLLASGPEAFGLARSVAALLVQAVFAYLLVGSAGALTWLWWRGRQRPSAATSGDVKISCRHCGGHIAFPAHGVGQQMACPHCAQSIKLQVT
jgi:hypothetical protein